MMKIRGAVLYFIQYRSLFFSDYYDLLKFELQCRKKIIFYDSFHMHILQPRIMQTIQNKKCEFVHITKIGNDTKKCFDK